MYHGTTLTPPDCVDQVQAASSRRNTSARNYERHHMTTPQIAAIRHAIANPGEPTPALLAMAEEYRRLRERNPNL